MKIYSKVIIVFILIIMFGLYAKVTYAAVAFRSVGTGSQSTATTSVTINVPAGVQQNDILIAGFTYGGSGVTFSNIPAGWNVIPNTTCANAQTTASNITMYYKIATASEPASYTWTASTTVAYSGFVSAYSGGNTSSPINTSNCQTNGTSGATTNQYTAPSITTTQGNTMIVTVHGTYRNATPPDTFTAPGGMNERSDYGINTGGRSISTHDVIQAANGATGTKTATLSNNSYGASAIIAINQSPSAPTISAGPAAYYGIGPVTAYNRSGPNNVWRLDFTATDAEQTGANAISYQIRNASGGGGTLCDSGNATTATPVSTTWYAYNTIGSCAIAANSSTTLYLRISDGTLAAEQSYAVITDTGNPGMPPSFTTNPSPVTTNSYTVTFTPSDTVSTNANEIDYEIYTGANRNGTFLTSGSSTTGVQKTTASFTDNGLVGGANTRHIIICDGAANCINTTFVVNYAPPPSGVTNEAYSNLESYRVTLNGQANPNGSATTGHFRVYTKSPTGGCTAANDAATVDGVATSRYPLSSGQDLNLGSGTGLITSATNPAFTYTIPLDSAQTLLPNTSYWYCAYAINSTGTTGATAVQSFVTPDGPSSPCDPPTSGNMTIPTGSNCTFNGTYIGVDSGTGTRNTAGITVGAGVYLTINAGQRIGFGSLSLGRGSRITMARGASLVGGGVYVQDADGDTYLDSQTPYVGSSPPGGYVRQNTLATNYNYAWKMASASATVDCNNASANVYRKLPGLLMVIDNDKDGYKTAAPALTNHCIGSQITASGRTYFTATSGAQMLMPDAQKLSVTTDCDDNNVSLTLGSTYYQDSDGDTYGNNAVSQSACSPPGGYVANNTDCNDGNINVYQNLNGYTDSDTDGYGNQYTSVTGNAGTTAEVLWGTGTRAWTSPTSNNVSSSNDVYNTAAANTGIWEYFRASNFGLAGVSGTIRGIVVEIERKSSVGTNTTDYSVRLVNASGTIVGNSYADDTTLWGTSDAVKTYGSSTDLWGASWTAADVMDTDFGVVIAPRTTGSASPSIDHIRIRVYYGNALSTTPVCSGAALPSGYSSNNTDCNDSQNSYYQLTLGYNDLDADGVKTSTSGNRISVCSGAALNGYSGSAGSDCADTDGTAWQNLSCYQDSDWDQYTVGGAVSACVGSSCTSTSLYRSAASTPVDCYDGNSNARPLSGPNPYNSSNYYETQRGDGSFDFDCSGTVTKQQILACNGSQSNFNGWYDGGGSCVPVSGAFVMCYGTSLQTPSGACGTNSFLNVATSQRYYSDGTCLSQVGSNAAGAGNTFCQ